MIKIKTSYGFNLSYDERRRLFVITETDGTEVGIAKSQDEAEVKAKALSKREFKRIKIVLVKDDGGTTEGELTSLNSDDVSAWVSMEKSDYTWGSGRSKIDLRYDRGYFEATPANAKIIESIRAKRLSIDQALKDIAELKGRLESSINKQYFGLV